MNEQLKDEFGKDILDSIEYFYNEKDKDVARMFMDAHPEVTAALDRKGELTVLTPILSQYYGGIDTLDRYLTSKMFDDLETKYGSNITRASQEYSDAKYRLLDNNLAKRILADNPNLTPYWKEKGKKQDEITRSLSLFGSKFEEIKLSIRPDYKGTFEQKQPTSYNEWREIMGDPMMQAMDNFMRGGEMPKNVESELDYLAGKYGYESGGDLAVEVMSSQTKSTGIPQAYIARDVINTADPALLELIAGGELPSVAIKELQYMASKYGITPDEVLQILASQ
jgi:hypothetical protein